MPVLLATRALSPCCTSISSIRQPSTSAITWARVVSSPWPCEAMPKQAVTAPVGSMRIVAVSVPVLIGIPGATEIREPMPVSST